MKLSTAGFTWSLRAWGVWPCAVMVLSQWSAAQAVGMSFPHSATLLTLSGTLAMYGADRFLERRHQQVTADRHLVRPVWDVLFLFLAGLAAWFGFPHINLEIIIWLAVLGMAGVLYLSITVGLIPTPVLVKEIVGAFCFSCLVWGLLRPVPLPVASFFLMAVSNFLWSSHSDRERDKANSLFSLACLAPDVNLILARGTALSGALGLFMSAGLTSPLTLTALAHGLWPRTPPWPIDLAFLPLLLVLI